MLNLNQTIIPRTMATQHPDNAAKPFWNLTSFVSAAEEVRESVIAWDTLGCEEVKWDWEGKLVDESVLERLFLSNGGYFQTSPLGEKKFLTFRIPHPDKELGGRYWRSLTNVVTARILASQLGLTQSPVTEIIVPMTESSREIIRVHQDLLDLHDFYLTKRFTSAKQVPALYHVIPLVESIEHLAEFDTIINEYLNWHQKQLGYAPAYIRPYIARSDPALESGLLAAVLSSRLAVKKLHSRLSTTSTAVYPILGVGSLPFRGGLMPATAGNFLEENSGVATVTIQSAFRYDHPQEEVERAIETINSAPFSLPSALKSSEEVFLREAIRISQIAYQHSLEPLLPILLQVAAVIPKRRERFSSQDSPFVYQRETVGTKLPRAIGFTGALYSIGIPPELLGSGKAISQILRLKNGSSLLLQLYPMLTSHLNRAGRFLNKANLATLVKEYPSLLVIEEDVRLIEAFLETELGPETELEIQHQTLTSEILRQIQNQGEMTLLQSLIEQSALLRKSIG